MANLLVFLFGLAIGSFLNVVIFRLEKEEEMIFRPLHCLYCNHNLQANDLIPILSFLLLRGKCRYCRQKISWQYPLVEMVTGLAFLLIWNFSLPLAQRLPLLGIACALIVIFVFDWKHCLIPGQALYPALAFAIAYHYPHFEMPYIWAGLGFAFTLFIPYFISHEEWMGLGDVELAGFLGFWLGPEKSFLCLLLASFIGAIIGLSLVVAKKKSMKSSLPFGPLLILGGILAYGWGDFFLNYLF